MGQQASSECTCQDGFFHMCTPEDPSKEAQSQLTPSPVPGYPAGMSAANSERGGANGPAPAISIQPPMRQDNGPRFGFGEDQQQGGFIPPPPQEDRSPMAGLPPPREPSSSPPPPQPAGSKRGGPSAAPNSSSPGRREVTADDILSNLEGSEEVLYGEAFASFPGGLNGFVMLDCVAMRDFICTNSSISMDDIDLELLKIASPDEGLSLHGFLHLLREFSISDGDSISHFMGLSSDGETLVAEECRSGLLLFAQQRLMTNFNDDRWECIFNTVMWDASVSVSMEQWINYCKFTGRIVRLLRYGQL